MLKYCSNMEVWLWNGYAVLQAFQMDLPLKKLFFHFALTTNNRKILFKTLLYLPQMVVK